MKTFAILFAMVVTMVSASAAQYDVTEKDIATLQADMSADRVTSEQLVQAYLKRIDRLDRDGPRLQSVIAVNPNALADARALDAGGRPRERGVRCTAFRYL